jgi:hypothetical protein
MHFKWDECLRITQIATFLSFFGFCKKKHHNSMFEHNIYIGSVWKYWNRSQFANYDITFKWIKNQIKNKVYNGSSFNINTCHAIHMITIYNSHISL